VYGVKSADQTQDAVVDETTLEFPKPDPVAEVLEQTVGEG
jgi:hypothetical protein